jgi:hypothetical protein
MIRKTIDDKLTFDHEVAAQATPGSKLKSTRTGRFLRNRGTHHLEGVLVMKYVATRAHNSALSPAGRSMQLVSPAEHQQSALNAWEDEGGKVRLQASQGRSSSSR